MTTFTQIHQNDANQFITSENLFRTRFLVRHGQCISNIKWPMDNYSDDIDVLTDLGIYQAKNVCRFFTQFNIRYQVISSTLNRAIKTANLICGELAETELQTPDYRLIEKNHEEPYEDFKSRVLGFITERLVEDGPYIIVAHGHLIETLLLEFMGAPYQLAERSDGTIGLTGLWGVANGSVSAFIDDKFVMFNHVP